MIKARIIITAFNNDDDLNKCIQSLQAQTRKDFEVVIVNNGSQPIKNNENWSSYKWLTMMQSDANSGFAGGSNLGAQGARTDWIITLNPDAWPKPNWYETLMNTADAHPDYAMLSSTLLKASDPNILDGAGDYYSIYGMGWRSGQNQSFSAIPACNRDVLSPCGAAAAYKRDVFEANNGFDATFFCYLEDLDLALRLQSQNYKCLHVYNACAIHVSGGSTGKNSSFQLYYTHKNQLRLMAKNTPVWILIIQLPLYMFTQLYLLARTLGTPYWGSRVRGLKSGLLLFPKDFFFTRHNVQKRSENSTIGYMKRISWSLKKLRNKAF